MSKQLISREQHDEMWMPQTIIPVRTVSNPYKTHFSGYGLGWIVSDVKGYQQVTHTGGSAGMVTQIVLIPELKLGIMVPTHQQVSLAFNATTNTIKDGYLDIPRSDWVTFYNKRYIAGEATAQKITDGIRKVIDSGQEKQAAGTDTQLYIGTYADQWFGEVTITTRNGRLWFEANQPPKLRGELLAYKGNTFIATWIDRSMNADAYVTFTTNIDGKASGCRMKSVSPLTDFSFDFQDLDLKKIQ